jgi:hypothetical protein
MGRIELDNMEDINYILLSTGLQSSDPKLYDIIKTLNDNCKKLEEKNANLLALIRTVQDFVSMPY